MAELRKYELQVEDIYENGIVTKKKITEPRNGFSVIREVKDFQSEPSLINDAFDELKAKNENTEILNG